ncbi:MAG: type III pantothenate kinase [Casimicrobiaceae bacterium]
MSQTLVLDLGNSRMKWGLHGPRGWAALGVTPNAEIGTLSLRDWQNLPRPVRAVGVNVAGEAARVRVEAQIARWRLVPQWLASSAAACGVSNGYRVPGQLGADRWASLVAARQRTLAGESPQTPAVVVNAGTAVTIDALDADGRFLGGLILPGLRLMLRALAENTAALKVPPGTFSVFPDNTPDALYAGSILAVTGAIAQVRASLDRDNVVAHCFLAGGAAHEIAPHLTPPVEVVDNLVLEGVLALADA